MHEFVEVAELAGKQGGVVSRSQVLSLGFHASAFDRAVASGLLVRQLIGVYRVASTPPVRDVKLWAALLWAGDGAVLSHRTAGWVWKLDGLGLKPPDVVDVTVVARRKRVAVPEVQLHRTSALTNGADFGKRDRLPVTSLARTLVDLASVLTSSELDQAYASARRKSEANRAAVLEALDRLGTRGRAGAASLAVIAGRYELGNTQSTLEDRVREALRRAQIPLPMPQLQICDEEGQIGIFDFAWPDRSLVICVDSWQFHSARDPFETDRSQAARLRVAGWSAIPITSRQLDTHEARFISQIRKLYDTGQPITLPEIRRRPT